MAQGKGYDWIVGGDLPELGRHSAVKHEIFDAYIGAYIRTLTKSHLVRELNLTIVDGFCGGGRYMMDGAEVDGSPLRMLASVERAQVEVVAARARGVEIKAEFVFVDANRNHIDFLRDLLERQGHGGRIGRDIHIVTSKFEDAADGVISRIQAKGRAHRSLFFLDQYGWSAVTFATIRRIMGSLQNPEVVLTFMVDHLVNLLNARMIDTAGFAAVDLDREDVQDMLRMKQMRGWKRYIQNTLYEHIRRNTGADYYTPFFIHPDGGSNRDYWLLHLSKHHQAREEMGKIHWLMENTFEHFGRAGFDSLGFKPGEDVREDMLDYGFNDNARTRSEATVVDQLARMLHARAIAGAGPLTKKALFASHCNDAPVIGDIVDAALLELRGAKDVIVTSPDGALRRSVKKFGWDDEIRLSREPGLFSIFDQRAA
ncbi:three-Cys-motif partner protein TcmP [Sphingomonas sp. CFBP 8760]|uniref:three-Cys-motif partner protein TcmP n=1 Tax=Sphingomonas sp. CFBP 8760 TaxID=2775282 RepID=UPI00178592FC|nr:three-Cys-motif partner protein TcmP [Sphingomonas sp. CFBP 8760]MBD8546033.1 three-Cys-motif partner protein TcmP [Sphingomonas sp. CFBP 8760]